MKSGYMHTGTSYIITTGYEHNVFGADEHYAVYLYRRDPDGSDTFINSWSYSTFLQERLAHWRAEQKIKRLKTVYDARVE